MAGQRYKGRVLQLSCRCKQEREPAEQRVAFVEACRLGLAIRFKLAGRLARTDPVSPSSCLRDAGSQPETGCSLSLCECAQKALNTSSLRPWGSADNCLMERAFAARGEALHELRRARPTWRGKFPRTSNSGGGPRLKDGPESSDVCKPVAMCTCLVDTLDRRRKFLLGCGSIGALGCNEYLGLTSGFVVRSP